MALGLGYYSCEVLPEELARVAVHTGSCSSLVRASDTSRVPRLPKGRSPVPSIIHITPIRRARHESADGRQSWSRDILISRSNTKRHGQPVNQRDGVSRPRVGRHVYTYGPLLCMTVDR